jgi:hypothetical protein
VGEWELLIKCTLKIFTTEIYVHFFSQLNTKTHYALPIGYNLRGYEIHACSVMLERPGKINIRLQQDNQRRVCRSNLACDAWKPLSGR